MWYLLTEKDRYLYHYTTAATAANYILRDKKLRLSRFEKLNDPREAKEWSFDFAYSDNNPSIGALEKIAQSFNKQLKDNWRMGCFVTDVAASCVCRSTSGHRVEDAMYERGHSRPRMWAQYANDHKGVCLVFDAEQLRLAVPEAAPSNPKHFGYVTYLTNPRPPRSHFKPDPLRINVDHFERLGCDSYAEQHSLQFAGELFFTKQRDWEHEREYRVLVYEKSDADIFVSIESALVGIALGQDCPEYARRKAGQYARRFGISVAEMDWQNGLPQPKPIHANLLPK